MGKCHFSNRFMTGKRHFSNHFSVCFCHFPNFFALQRYDKSINSPTFSDMNFE